MRILLLSASYPPVLGGLQTATHALARQWQASGHQVEVITQRHPRHLPAREVLDGVPLRRELFLMPSWGQLRRGRPDLFLAGLYAHVVTQVRLESRLRAFQPDVLNLHFPDSQIPFVLKLQKKYSLNLVVSLHGHELLKHFDDSGHVLDLPSSGDGIGMLRTVLQAADRVTACSGYLLKMAEQVHSQVIQKGCVVYNGVELSRFSLEGGHSHSRPYLFSYGRLTHKKGFDLLLQAFARFAGENPAYDLILAGEGDQRATLEDLAQNLGLSNRVIFFGRASPKEIVNLLTGSRLVIIPSRVEPFGIVALEGLAAGKPILAARVGGLPEILAETGNRLVEPTVEGLAAGLAWLSEPHDWAALARENRQVAARYSWGAAAGRFCDMFSQV
jgi:glycogen synthase